MKIEFNSATRVEVTNRETLEFLSYVAVQGDVWTLGDNVEITLIPLGDETIQNEEKSE